MSTLVLLGDSRALLRTLPADSVQCVVTSPPYYKLRDYLAADNRSKALEIGQEETPADYVASLVEVFRCIRRVLHPTGVAFLNLGDSYSAGGNVPGSGKQLTNVGSHIPARRTKGFRPKNLLLVPYRAAIALQDDGWTVRSHIAWTKNNPMPDSSKDRPTSAWESVFLLTKKEQYFWDYEGAKETAISTQGSGNKERTLAGGGQRPGAKPGSLASGVPWQPTGQRNMRNVWPINAVPYPGAHSATFPLEIPLRAIRAATSEAGCCPACRAPYRRILETKNAKGDTADGGVRKKTPIGWEPTCACPPRPPVPCLVLDPFGGSGTTVAAAEQLGRDGIMIDLNLDSAMLARDRLVKARRQRRPQDQGT